MVDRRNPARSRTLAPADAFAAVVDSTVAGKKGVVDEPVFVSGKLVFGKVGAGKLVRAKVGHRKTGSRKARTRVRRDTIDTPGPSNPGPRGTLLIPVPSQAAGQRILDVLSRLTETSARSDAAAAKLVDMLIPDLVTELSPGVAAQVARNADLLGRIDAEFGLLPGPLVGEMSGSTAGNLSQTALRWRSAGRIFSVTKGGRPLYPAFQFEDGQPKKVVSEVIARFGSAADSGWALALWFVSANSYLGGRRPVDVLDDDPAAVLVAASRVLEPGP